MKRLILILLVILLGVGVPNAAAFAAPDAAPFAKLSFKKKKLTMEVPDSLIGRRVVLSTAVAASTSPYPPVGKIVSKNEVFTVSKVDSAIVLTLCSGVANVIDAEANIEDALERSQAQAISYVFPIKKRVNGGWTIEVNKLFDPGSLNAVSLEGVAYGPYEIKKAEYKANMSSVLGVEYFGSSIAVRTDATFKLKLRTQMIVFDLDDDFFTTMDLVTSLTLLPRSGMQHKKADSRIGTFNTPVGEYSDSRGVKNEAWVCRWDLSEGKTIDIYVDTLFAAAEAAAIREGFEAWNDALEKAGVGRKICVADFPRDTTFRAYDPLVSTVTRSRQGGNVSASTLNDGTDRLLAAHFYVPDGYVQSVRRRSVYAISDVDTRYKKYHLSEDAVCEVLRADVIRVAGQCLGIAPNFAGSMAYTPAQLRDPEFTQAYGFTASAMDDVLFNYMTRPGDKERGVVTVLDRAGAYDVYALRWIYGDGKYDSSPEYFYAPLVSSKPDARVRRYDLSNDSEEAFRSGMEHLYAIAREGAAEYLGGEDVNEDYKQLFVDWIWLRSSNLVYLLTSNVGAYEYNAPREGSGLPKYRALPVELQRRSLAMAFDFWRHFEWLDKSEFVHIAGPNVNTSDMSRSNAFKMVNASFRFPFVAFAARYAGSGYSVEQYMKDMETEVFKVMLKGSMTYGEMMIAAQYVSWLSGARASDVPGAGEIAARYLRRAEKQLRACRGAMATESQKREIDYLLQRWEQLEKN